ncbi:hypothetical protein C5F59_003025 [Streptomyces sp. QL37]|uniref:hypothetical protein n=1 Tax=Streptomyces sp. QL37 TaxID=2093747 RepID=UPI000CF208A0|nr:hypothetical protein [Streptomyces sp. QL37]PPQ55780.1 hypothetical protein C5F59_03060 [Streptomyces sp. QL37]
MRAAAVRFVLAILMGFLLAPHSGTPSGDAHASVPGFEAAALPEAITGQGQGEYGMCGTSERGGESNGLLRHRDRHRSANVPAPDAPSRSVVTIDADGLLAPAAVAAMGSAPHTSRSSTAHSSTVLQVFRC